MTWEEYEKKLGELGYKDEAISQIKPVFEFAKKTHSGEKRSSGEPYFIHPVAVSLGIAELKLDKDAVAAALLHDVVENQGIKVEEIKKQFGQEIAFLVEALTKAERVQYKGVERAVESLRKMFLALSQDIRVVIIKLMDRMHNMETLKYLPQEKQKRIALETLELYAPLADRLGMWDIKAKLEDLTFPYVYPEEYKWLTNQIKHKKEGGEKYLERLKPIVGLELKKEGVEVVKITYRAKHLYSIWKKLIKYEMNFEKVLDLVAMRIIVKTPEDCYRTLGVIHKLWRPMPGRIKDFIALPKLNGYKSLHTTVFGPEKKKVDIQIRTGEMDSGAENGIAAHWFYEAEGKKQITQKLDKNLAWVTQLQEWSKGQGEAAGEEALKNLKIDFFKDRIFTLTPKGDVVDLPDGATPVDFAYHIHSEIGDRMFGAKVNGKMVAFSHLLKSGDTVEILTQKNKKPTGDWLDIAKTSLAKNRIRSFLRKEGISESSHKKNKEVFEAVITIKDRVGILRDVSSMFSNLGINIVETKSGPLSRDHHRITISFLPKKNIPETKLLTSIKKIKNVDSVLIRPKAP